MGDAIYVLPILVVDARWCMSGDVGTFLGLGDIMPSPHTTHEARPRSARARFAWLLGLVSLVMSLLAVPGTPAQAAPNPDIVVGNVTLESEDGGQLTVGDSVTVHGEWDASTANPQPGDEFTIGLPPELAFDEAVPFQLIGADGTVWGNCLTDPATGVATCVLTDAVVERPEDVKGEFEFEVTAVQATDEEEVIFDLNGEDTSVDLPGEGGIDDGFDPPAPWDKSGELNSNKWSVGWTINLPGDRLVGHDTVNVSESLSDNHQLCDPSNLKVVAMRGTTVVDVTGIATVTPGADPQHFTITLTEPDGGWDPSFTYRITFDTCTPDNQIDPIGTEYTNEAHIDIWDEGSGVIGVEQDWNWEEDITKSGTVLGGGDRNGRIEWRVGIAGDHLLGKDGFTFTDSLTGPHELCDDSIVTAHVYEQLGPSGEGRVDITEHFSVVDWDVAPGRQDFTVEVRTDGFEFKPSDYIYGIIYESCVTTDGLPESGTDFGNTVNVDGAVVGTETEVPGRTDQKRGSINTGPVTLDGVEYLPQTTMNWTITVPGEKLADIDSDLVISDVISGEHEICGDGDDVAARLGLKVEARDQIQNGGLATVDLTSSATAAETADGFAVTLPPPTLPQPDGGEATGFSREYQYVVTYTTCTTSGGMDAPGTEYGNSAEVAGSSYEHSVTQNNKGSGTGEGVSRGSVAIDKELTDDSGDQFVPDDATFTVHVKEIDPTGTVQIEYDLEVPLDGEPVSGPNSRGHGWTIELSEPTFPDIPGVVFGDPVFAPGDGVIVSPDGQTATAALEPGRNISVTLTNSAHLGSVEIVKLVEGGAASMVPADQTYDVTAEIDTSALGDGFPEQPDRQLELVEDVPVVLEDLPIGATVHFSEIVPADDDTLAWGEPEISPESITITGDHVDQPAQVTVTNTVERNVGTFWLVKEVEGPEAENPAVPDTVTVTATWTMGPILRSMVIEVPTDGTPVPFGEDLPIGTEVTLSETLPADGSGIAWGEPTWSGDGVVVEDGRVVLTIGHDDSATVTVTNLAQTPGTLSIAKHVDGLPSDHADFPDSVTVTATWIFRGEEQSKELTLPTDGTVVDLDEDLPPGTEVTLSEPTRADGDDFTWSAPEWAGGDAVTANSDGTATVIIGAGQTAEVELTNTAEPKLGALSLRKVLSGSGGGDVPAGTGFPATLTWTDLDGEAQERDVTLKAGTTVEVDDFPIGTEVEITEDGKDAGGATWSDVTWTTDDDNVELVDNGKSGAVVTVTGDDGAHTTLTVDNSFTKSTTPGGGGGGGSTSLPNTGFDLSIWQLLTLLLIGSGLVVGGGALLYRSRRAE